MANFYQVFKNGPICKYAESYCEYDGDVEVVCGKCAHGKLFCSKCSEYEPNEAETGHIARPVPTRFATTAERRMTMAEYIPRSEAITELRHRCYPCGEGIEAINGIPAADVVPVVHGRWIMHDDEFGLTCECSACHIETMGDGNYCPNCGAKMDGSKR